ncbi:DUF2767 family protein [Citrobacter freundii]|uniref:DUF2767 family protein n=1 Tax=Citrobacter freundii TaxID=546 RepID=UPI001F3E0EC0|nr:DUF2767 family protein [Citrobacter freundii]
MGFLVFDLITTANQVIGSPNIRKTGDSMSLQDEVRAYEIYAEMCQIVGDAVFGMVAAGHETKKVAIADVLRTEILRKDKWDERQIQMMELAVKLLEE